MQGGKKKKKKKPQQNKIHPADYFLIILADFIWILNIFLFTPYAPKIWLRIYFLSS